MARYKVDKETVICPRCTGVAVKIGFTPKGTQRWLCENKRCKKKFVLNSKFSHRTFPLLCSRCRSKNVTSHQYGYRFGGWKGYCKVCKKHFTQGGKRELSRNIQILKDRVAATGYFPEAKEELFQQAYVDILRGKGYCDTVKLNRKQAVLMVNGTPGLGSDHPVFRED